MKIEDEDEDEDEDCRHSRSAASTRKDDALCLIIRIQCIQEYYLLTTVSNLRLQDGHVSNTKEVDINLGRLGLGQA